MEGIGSSVRVPKARVRGLEMVPGTTVQVEVLLVRACIFLHRIPPVFGMCIRHGGRVFGMNAGDGGSTDHTANGAARAMSNQSLC